MGTLLWRIHLTFYHLITIPINKLHDHTKFVAQWNTEPILGCYFTSNNPFVVRFTNQKSFYIVKPSCIRCYKPSSHFGFRCRSSHPLPRFSYRTLNQHIQDHHRNESDKPYLIPVYLFCSRWALLRGAVGCRLRDVAFTPYADGFVFRLHPTPATFHLLPLQIYKQRYRRQFYTRR